MPRKKVNCSGEKSTVQKIKDSFDWGRILYNACYVFNKGFADYLEEYANKYDKGEIVVDDIEQETNELIGKRDSLIDERSRLHEAVRLASSEKANAFREYIRMLPVGEIVTSWRKSILSGENSGETIEQYRNLINSRSRLNSMFHSYLKKEKSAEIEERKHIDANLFVTRTINRRVKNIIKMVGKHRIPLGHSMLEEIQPLKEMILSEQQTERLMAVCLNILNTYSEKEFSTLMDVSDRERIVEKIYDFFSNFEHNYDFVSGCYDIDEETNSLKLKPLNVLETKIYNGYYFTIRGYVQRAYASIRFERFNIESVDANWQEETDNGNHGIDKKLSNESDVEFGGVAVSHEPMPLDEGMMDIWKDCNVFLMNNIESMSSEISEELSKRFPRNPYYKIENIRACMPVAMMFIVDSINKELMAGNAIGSKLKHIILDSVGGTESNEEWRQNVLIISRTMTKYIRQFFMTQKCRHVETDEEMELAGND